MKKIYKVWCPSSFVNGIGSALVLKILAEAVSQRLYLLLRGYPAASLASTHLSAGEMR